MMDFFVMCILQFLFFFVALLLFSLFGSECAHESKEAVEEDLIPSETGILIYGTDDAHFAIEDEEEQQDEEEGGQEEEVAAAAAAAAAAAVDSYPVPMIYGSPEAELYFRQSALTPGSPQSVSIQVDDLSARSSLIVRPLSSPDCHIEPQPVQVVKSETASTLLDWRTEGDAHSGDGDEFDEEVPFTEEEDAQNKSHAARVASRLDDLHRPVPGEDPLEHRAEQMAEAIVASAVFETVFLQPEREQQQQSESPQPAEEDEDEDEQEPDKVPFIGSSLCRIRLPLSPALSSSSLHEGIFAQLILITKKHRHLPRSAAA